MARMKLIKCPLCQGKIEIDLNTGVVYRHFDKLKNAEAEKVFGSALDKVADKDEVLDNLFAKAKDREKNRDLDALFKKAAEKSQQDEEEEEKDPDGEPEE